MSSLDEFKSKIDQIKSSQNLHSSKSLGGVNDISESRIELIKSALRKPDEF